MIFFKVKTMESLMELLKERRSIRKFTGDPVPMSLIEKTLEAARWAPSTGNSQPWQFVIVTNKEIVDSIKAFSPGMIYAPSAIVVLCLHKDRLILSPRDHFLDIGAAMQNMLLTAHSLGLGCTPIFSFDKEATSELLSLPNRIKPVLLVAMGYPKEKPSTPPRISLDELVEAKIE